MTAYCESCEAETTVGECRRAGVKLSLCSLCMRRDIIGMWKMEFRGEVA